MRVLAIDPSLTCTGWALFDHGKLTQCGYVTTRHKLLGMRILDLSRQVPGFVLSDSDALVIEVPQIYTRDKSEGDPNNLTPLWGIAGAILAKHPSALIELIKPAKWKKQPPKPVTFARIIRRLEPKELEIFNRDTRRPHGATGAPTAKARAGDALDAIGVGLYYLGRYKPIKKGAPK